MNMQIQFQIILGCILISLAPVEPQLLSFSRNIFKPAINAFNVLTGRDDTNNDQIGDSIQNQQSSNLRSQNQLPNYRTASNDYPTNSVNYRRQVYQPETKFRSYSSSSPCGQFFTYQNEYGEKSGLLSIPNPDRKKNVVVLNLSLAAQLSSNYVGTIELLKDKQTAVDDIVSGFPILYRVKFPLQDPLPKPTSIYLNNQLLCSGPKEVAPYVTSIALDFTFLTGLFPGVSDNFPPQPAPHLQPFEPVRPFYTTSKSFYEATTTQPPPPPQSPIVIQHRSSYNHDFKCGIPQYRPPAAAGLVVGGQVVNRGQFPWLAAYFHNGPGDSGFICGGSLVSTKLVVTAAHCIQEKNDQRLRKAEQATFYIGKHNIQVISGEQNFIMSGVTQLIVHPDWNPLEDRYDADIAIAVLLVTVQFTKFVRPICLWTSTSSYEDLVGRTAFIAGWGKTEFSAITSDIPKWAAIPVVNMDTCIRSNYAFSALTSDRTFCAGTRDGYRGPCNGDSGGALVAKSGSTWYLRGIVSAALLDQTLATCDIKNFAVFTDAVRFNSWMQGYIQQYG